MDVTAVAKTYLSSETGGEDAMGELVASMLAQNDPTILSEQVALLLPELHGHPDAPEARAQTVFGAALLGASHVSLYDAEQGRQAIQRSVRLPSIPGPVSDDHFFDYNTNSWVYVKKETYPSRSGYAAELEYKAYRNKVEQFEAQAKEHGTSQWSLRYDEGIRVKRVEEAKLQQAVTDFNFERFTARIAAITSLLQRCSRTEATVRLQLLQILDIYLGDFYTLCLTFVRWLNSHQLAEDQLKVIIEKIRSWRTTMGAAPCTVQTITDATASSRAAMAADILLDLEGVLQQKLGDIRRTAQLESIAASLVDIRNEVGVAVQTLRSIQATIHGIDHRLSQDLRTLQQLQWYNLMGVQALGEVMSSFRIHMSTHTSGGLFGGSSRSELTAGPTRSFHTTFSRLLEGHSNQIQLRLS